MRTKTLLLTAALTAAGIATSMAQVYSVNAVGYVKTTLKPGFNLISNPLSATSNKIRDVFANIAGGIPGGLTVYKFSGTFATAAYDTDLADWDSDVADQTLVPGEGAFVLNPTASDKVITFVGEVSQGALSTTLPVGFSIQSSKVPQAGVVDADLKLPVDSAETVFKFNATTQVYASAAYDTDLAQWDTDTGAGPSIGVGEAFFLLRSAAGSWTRTFSVNQ